MSNYRRAYVPGGVYFFTVVTYNRTPWFNNEGHIDILRDSFYHIMEKRPYQIDAIVVLPDHLHCIWQLPPDDSDFSGRWREIKKRASRYIAPQTNKCNERLVWQKRFWEHLIRDDEDWKNHVDYIHFNPVKHGLVESVADWPWSSFSRAVENGWYDSNWGGTEPEAISGMELE